MSPAIEQGVQTYVRKVAGGSYEFGYVVYATNFRTSSDRYTPVGTASTVLLAEASRAQLPTGDAARRCRLDAAIQKREECRRAKRPPQEFDTSSLPLFGDASRQIELF